MARLPRYQAGQIQAAVPGRVEFAGMREKARFAENIGKMAAFVNREVQAREAKRTKEEEAANDLQQRMAIDNIVTAANVEMTSVYNDAEAAKLPFTEFQKQAQDVFDGFAGALEGLDPEYAGFALNDLNRIVALKGEQYSVVDQKRSLAEMRANALTGLEQRVIESQYLANSESFDDNQAAIELARINDFMITNQFTPEEISKTTNSVRKGMYEENAVAKFGRLTSIEEKQDYINKLNIRQLGPEKTRALGKTLQAQLNSEISRTKSLATALKGDIKDQLRILTKGGNPSIAVIADLESKASQLAPYDPEIAEEMDNFTLLRENLLPMRLMNPLQLEQELLEIEQGIPGRGKEGLDTEQEVLLASEARSLLNNMTTEIKQDPLAYAMRVGHVEFEPLDIGDPNMAAERRVQARQVAGIYGIEETFLTDAEATQISGVLEGQADKNLPLRMNILSNIVNNFAKDAPKVLAQIAPKQSELAQIGGMVSLGLFDTATIALKGMDNIAIGNVPVEFTPANTDFMFQSAAGTAFNFQPEARAATRKVANAIYTQKAFEQGLETFDANVWEESIQLAAGYDPKTGNGGIQEVRDVSTLLPKELDADKVESMLNSLTAQDIFDQTGLEVTDKQVKTIQKDAKLYVHSHGYYYMGIGQPGMPGFRYIADKRKNPVVIDALKFYGFR
jgi:hypothetical protein